MLEMRHSIRMWLLEKNHGTVAVVVIFCCGVGLSKVYVCTQIDGYILTKRWWYIFETAE